MSLEHLDTALGFAVIMLLLSLLITVLVQAISAVLGLRGSNLRWGVARLLTQIDPNLAQHAQEIAERALRHPAIAPIGKRGATAIRADELIRVLDDVVMSDAPWRDPKAQAALQQGTRKLVAGVQTWFDTIMDRTTERFVLHARWVTAAVAFAFALALHVDSLQLLQRLSTDSEFRSSVVAVSARTLQQAEDVVALTAERKALGSQAVAAAREEVGATPAAAAVGTIPPTLVTRQQGEAWLRERVKDVNGADTLLAAYNRRFDEATRVWLGELRASTGAIDQHLRAATFELIPSPYPGWRKYYKEPRHLVGTVMTALLLSLGAPFWFNVLRQLANLRPAIAAKVDTEKAAK